MSSGSSTDITQWSIYLILSLCYCDFNLSIVNIPKNYLFFSFLTKFNIWLFLPKTKKCSPRKMSINDRNMENCKVNYLSLYSGCSSHHCSHSGIRHPSLACCSIVVPSSQAHLSKYGNSRSISYHS